MELQEYFNNKTILITGATGLIGSNLAKSLLCYQNVRLILVGRSKEKLRQVYSKLYDLSNICFLQHDINRPLPTDIGDVDIIFHAASPISGDIIDKDPTSVISANLNGFMNCIDFIRDKGHGSLLIFSSATVYGMTAESDRIVTEKDTSITLSLDNKSAPYSESKRMIEVMAKAYVKQFVMDIKIARIGYVYGYAEYLPNTALYNFIKQAKNGKDIVLNKYGFGRRDNIYVDDVVEGILVVAAMGNAGESYNISSAGDLDNFRAIDEMAEVISKIASNGTNVILPAEKGRAGGIIMDNKKLKSLGWRIKTSIFEGIKYIYSKV